MNSLHIRTLTRGLASVAAVVVASTTVARAQSLAYPIAHRDSLVENYFGTRVPAP